MYRHAMLAIAAIAVGCMVARAQPEPTTEPSTQPVSVEADAALSFDLKVPEGWRLAPVKSTGKDHTKLVIVPVAAGNRFDQAPPVLRVLEVDTSGGAPYKEAALTGIAERTASSISRDYSDGKLLAFDQMKIDGTPAYKVQTSGHTRGSKSLQTNTQFIAIHNGKLYGLYFSSDPEFSDKYLPDVTKIVESFRWKEAATTQPATRDSKQHHQSLPPSGLEDMTSPMQ